MRDARKRRSLALVLGLWGATLIGCSSGSDAVDPGPPEDVSGSWDYVLGNAEESLLSRCTGILSSMNGMTVADLLAAALGCTTTEDFVVTQSADQFAAVGQAFNCPDGSSYTLAGGGSVRGASLTGSIDLEHSSGAVGRELFTGQVTGAGQITLDVYRFTLSSGLLSGGCDLVPELRQLVTLVAAAPGALPTGTPRPPQRAPGRLVSAAESLGD